MSQPKVYIYTKYLDNQQTLDLNEALSVQDFEVEFNQFDFPTTITENTILYSLLLDDSQTLIRAENTFDGLGIPVVNVQGLTKGNHWYTKNSLAIFIFPKEKNAQTGVFKQDLAQTYQLEMSDGCEVKVELELKPNGKYRFIIDNPRAEIQTYLYGDWLYRQYPYLELRPENEPYSSAYFEISKVLEQDQISKIDFTQLTVIESKVVPIGCVLKYGSRY
ncbi:hypothetical protein AB6T38_14390 [Aliiglaciecola sp. SL4]|uniref:hypothetical protein n=1 Tax=Aliiglaciecola sp. SL4 TaxID=3239806 RepID=UPI00355C68E9